MDSIKNQLSVLKPFIISIGFSLVLLFLRVLETGSIFYLFLVWNLFLAIIPYGITTGLQHSKTLQKYPYLFWGVAILWLAFLPNAPYIITDLQHIRLANRKEIWFDVLLIASFAINGLYLAIASLRQMETILLQRFSKIKVQLLVTSICFLCGFGIYLGRFLRWNTWDVLNNPLGLMDDILSRIVHPIYHVQTWSFTLAFGAFLIVTYSLFNNLKISKNNN